jgi:predicted esterase
LTLDYIERSAAGLPVGALVFFHGYSGDPAEHVAFVDSLDPERRFHAFLPRAPHRHQGATSWFVRGSAEPVEHQLAPLTEWLNGLPYARDRTVLGGISQGANVAFSVGLGPRYERPAGIIALAGGFRDELPPDLERPLPPIAIGHGQADEVVPIGIARQTRAVLERAGGTVVYRETAASHEVGDTVLPDLRAFLARLP